MFSLFPSAYPQRQPLYYQDDDYFARDYIHALAQQQARERREAQYRAQLEEARQHKAYQEQLARAEAARRRNSIFLRGCDDEPYPSFSQPATHPTAVHELHTSGGHRDRTATPAHSHSQTRHNFLQDLTEQQRAAPIRQSDHTEPRDPKFEPMPSTSIPINVQSTEPTSEEEHRMGLPLTSCTPAIRDAAARKIQLFIRTHLPRLRAFEAIAHISRQFEDVKAAFEFPSMLDFAEPPTGDNAVPALLFTPRNAAIHGHENTLVKLLSKLDAVESHGDSRIRRARKQLVKRIESELGELDAKKAAMWEERTTESTPVEQDSSLDSSKIVDGGCISEEPARAASNPSGCLDTNPMDFDRSPSLDPNAGEGELEEDAVKEALFGPEESAKEVECEILGHARDAEADDLRNCSEE